MKRLDRRFSTQDIGTEKLLSEPEERILELVLEGLQNKEIAAGLGMSVHNVRYHFHHILHKFGKTNRIELFAALLRQARASRPEQQPQFTK